MRFRWVIVLWVAAITLLALAATWLGMSAAVYAALEPARLLNTILTANGA